VFRTTSDALEALARIEVVDRQATFSAAVDLAAEACALAPEVPTKRVVLIGDQQRVNWPAGAIGDALKQFPDLQIVQVAAGEAVANAWVADFRLQDDVADVDVPAVFTAIIRYEGPRLRPDVEVTLTIDNTRVAAQTIDLEPGQSRLVRFSHQFDLPVEAGEPVYVAATLALSLDQLPADDARHLSVPVVASLPVMFIDQYGAAGENPQKNRYGETFNLRRLLAPVSARVDSTRQLVKVRHVTPDQVERQYLEDCRLVVIAGIESPGNLTPLLRDYVEQGGRLLIAAGGHFDPVAWTNAAWLDGAGVLPLPIKSQPVGRLPDESAGKIEPFFLSPESMTADEFRIEDASPEELDDLYRTPLFFKAVDVDRSSEVMESLRETDARRALEQQRRREEVRRAREENSNPQAPAEQLAPGQTSPSGEEASWLSWGRDRADSDLEEPPETTALKEQPRVLASFSNGTPFLVDRQIGRGEVLFVSTGLFTGWNNLTRTHAVVIVDRLLRGLLARTLPRRNYSTEERVVIAVHAADRGAVFALEPPSGDRETLFVDAVSSDRFAITLKRLAWRGHYRVVAERPVDPDAAKPEAALSARASNVRRATQPDRLWQLALAVNGPPGESELQTVSEPDLHERLAGAAVHWVQPGEAIRLEGAAASGQEFWKWLMAAALACLVLELVVLTRSHMATTNRVRVPATRS
jgi:hypothetical protein